MIQNVSSIQLLNNTLKIFHNYFVTMKKVLWVQNYLGECSFCFWSNNFINTCNYFTLSVIYQLSFIWVVISFLLSILYFIPIILFIEIYGWKKFKDK